MFKRQLARALAGFGLCAAALSASAGPYSSMVVFGDSLSDGGNNALLLSNFGSQPLPPVVIASDAAYSQIPSAAGTYSNGMVWTQYLAQSLGVSLAPSLAGGTNFAFGGALTGADGTEIPTIPGFPFSMRTQLNSYLAATGHLADPNALYVVSGGGNNIRVALEAIAAGADAPATAAATVAGYAADMAGLVADLKAAGAQHVLVLNTPNFGLTPLAYAMDLLHPGTSFEASALSRAMDDALDFALTGSGTQVLDMYDFMTDAVANASALGFTNWTNACGVTNTACTTSLFWDGIHPTTLGHQVLAAKVMADISAVPEPDVAALFAVGLVVVALSRRRRAAVQQG